MVVGMADIRSKQAWQSWVDDSLRRIRQQKLERVLRAVVPTDNATQALIHEDERSAWLEGAPSPDSYTNLSIDPQQQSAAVQQQLRPLTLFSTNDYMGLATHPTVKAAAAQAALKAGCGPRSSALVAGFTSEHRQLELDLAALKGTHDALLFPTGYAANVAVMTVLASTGRPSSSTRSSSSSDQQQRHSSNSMGSQHPQVVIYSDELNHASIIDGARLAVRNSSTGSTSLTPGSTTAAVQLSVYRHNDLDHLEQLLAAAPATARKLVVTDSLFSMDGDFAVLPGLVKLKQRYGFLLVVDDAHATLVCGHWGEGAAAMMGVAAAVDVHVGTLSKAAGSLGGFVACSRAVRQLLLNRGRSIIYSTSLPVPVVAAARAALRVSQSESWRRQHVWSLTRLISQQLDIPAASPIIPLVVGSEAAALELSRQLLQKGYHVPAIRPPTVPAGTSRLRVSLSAGHTRSQVLGLITAVQEGLRDLPGVKLIKLPHLMDQRQQQYLQQWQGQGLSGDRVLSRL